MVAACCGAAGEALSFFSPNSEPMPENIVKPLAGVALAGAAFAAEAVALAVVSAGLFAVVAATAPVFFGAPLLSR